MGGDQRDANGRFSNGPDSASEDPAAQSANGKLDTGRSLAKELGEQKPEGKVFTLRERLSQLSEYGRTASQDPVAATLIHSHSETVKVGAGAWRTERGAVSSSKAPEEHYPQIEAPSTAPLSASVR